jgi:hypothetical protein
MEDDQKKSWIQFKFSASSVAAVTLQMVKTEFPAIHLTQNLFSSFPEIT